MPSTSLYVGSASFIGAKMPKLFIFCLVTLLSFNSPPTSALICLAPTSSITARVVAGNVTIKPLVAFTMEKFVILVLLTN